ncbi:MAG: aldolase/citrate lyase family protein [Candidatus Neomarinimicrobiota bacterium]
MTKPFRTGPEGDKPRSDLRVAYTSNSNPLSIGLHSRVEGYYGESIRRLASAVCKKLEVTTGHLKIEDFGAVPFVIAARLEAVLKQANPMLKGEYLLPFKKFAKGKSSRDRFRRSRLYIPGNQPKLMLNAGIHQPDGIILDLEDSVAPIEKEAARYIVRNALRALDFFDAERMVRINQGKLGVKDLECIVPHNVHLVLIPKVESATQIQDVDKVIKNTSRINKRKDSVYLMPIIESGRGVLKALEIAEASSNIVALAIGLEDYTADIGAERTVSGRESFFARSMIVNAARAAGIQAIDTVFSDVSDEKSLRASVREAKSLGFDGKGCIHPCQIGPVHEEFAPSEVDIERAKEIVLAFDKATKKGLGVVSLGSKMIDPPVVKRSQRIVKLATAMKLLNENWKSNHDK